jgi:catecholate siderophore receptor
MVTKTPHLRNFSSGEVSIGFDEYNSKVRKRVTTDLNYVIAPNTAFRLNALVEDSGIPGANSASISRGLCTVACVRSWHRFPGDLCLRTCQPA